MRARSRRRRPGRGGRRRRPADHGRRPAEARGCIRIWPCWWSTGLSASAIGRLLPAGPLREPLAAGLARATRDRAAGRRRGRAATRLLPPRLARLHARLCAGPDAPDLRDRRVVAFAGIGRPEKFFRSLAEAGALLVARHAFADHHRYRRREVRALLAEAAAGDALCVTTAKDRVRLPADLSASITILPVTVSWRDPAALAQVLDRLPNG